MATELPTAKLGRYNYALLKRLLVVTVVMFGFGYALVPIYKKICEVTGINVVAAQERSTEKASKVDANRMVTIEFDANVHSDIWRFRAEKPSVQVRPGDMVTMVYEVTNPKQQAMIAQAIPSYAPNQSATYFKKLDCFCFTEQTLKAGESRRMPVAFFIDPDLPKDIHTITLSYTFFEVKKS